MSYDRRLYGGGNDDPKTNNTVAQTSTISDSVESGSNLSTSDDSSSSWNPYNTDLDPYEAKVTDSTKKQQQQKASSSTAHGGGGGGGGVTSNSELALSLQRLDANGLRRVLERLLIESSSSAAHNHHMSASSGQFSSTPNIVREFVRNELDAAAAAGQKRGDGGDRDWNNDYQSILDDLKNAPQSQSLKYMSRFSKI